LACLDDIAVTPAEVDTVRIDPQREINVVVDDERNPV
jgi:hypothetical protein